MGALLLCKIFVPFILVTYVILSPRNHAKIDVVHHIPFSPFGMMKMVDFKIILR